MRFLLLLLLLLPSCTRQSAVEYTLSPAMVMSAKGIEKDAAGSADLADFSAAVAAKDWKAASVYWPMVKAQALDNISHRLEAGEIGPNVAESLRERLRVFESALEKTQ